MKIQLPYSFMYDLTQLPQSAFRQLLETALETGLHKVLSRNAQRLVKILKIDQITGLNLAEAITLVEDLIEVLRANNLQRERFEKAERKALLLPHCVRSHMDRQCMADFNPEVPTYNCNGCQMDCLVNRAVTLGNERGYDVYVIPGGSCAEKILRAKKYNGVVGVACGSELKMALGLLKKLDIPGQGVLLTKNGCAKTNLNLNTLEQIL